MNCLLYNGGRGSIYYRNKSDMKSFNRTTFTLGNGMEAGAKMLFTQFIQLLLIQGAIVP